jgi:hypothetical protein
VHPAGSLYIGNGSQLLWLANKQPFSLCSGQSFKRINGLDISSDMRIYFVDGFDIFGGSEIYRLDNVANCKLRLLADGAMVNGVQRLARTRVPYGQLERLYHHRHAPHCRCHHVASRLQPSLLVAA